ncbi:MAG TPA: hypothetical protein VF855_13545 [Acidimicrobiales bacterium]
MTIEFAGTWLDDVRSSWWYNKFQAKDPSVNSDGGWTYIDGDGNALYANKAEEILAVNAPFLEFFNQNEVASALYAFAEANQADGFNGAHSRAALSWEDGNVLMVEQGMHQPEDNDEGEGFCLHVTVRLQATSVAEDQDKLNAPRHAYMMQANDGSLYVTSMT